PTSMRGSGMEDVIFAGAATRPARNFAEVSVQIDNSDRLAPAGFNDADHLEIIRRITRDVGSAYKVNGKDVRARDVQMLFADASTGAHSPALVRQGQISELINAKPTARRRVLEEAAGISGLYQRRHEAELKLKGAEANLARVDDVIEQLANQLAQLARQARQAARYRQIGEELRHAEGLLLYLRWKEADVARAEEEAGLTESTKEAGRAEARAREAESLRVRADEALPPLREEEAIASAALQRLQVTRDTLSEQERSAAARIETLQGRIGQLTHDIEREEQLNGDAGETIARLEDEEKELGQASDGHEAKLEEAAKDAHDASTVLQTRETELSQLTEDVARLAARHQSALRLVEDSKTALAKHQGEAETARAAVTTAQQAVEQATQDFAAAKEQDTAAVRKAQMAETALADADDARGEAQAREADARAERSEAEGEVSALSAEVSALTRLLDRDTAEGGQILDLLKVASGFEKALGAALADELRSPEVAADGPSGWVALPEYGSAQSLPNGVEALSEYVSVTPVLARRISQIGLVDAEAGPRIQEQLKPGQRLVSVEGDLWRWDGYRAWAEDAPSAAALRLEQLNRVEELKQQLAHATARAEGASHAHETLKKRLVELTEADRTAREARRAADAAMADASRALSKSEADRNLARSRLETLGLAVSRHEEEAGLAQATLRDANKAMGDLEDLEVARAEVEDIKLTVEAARMTMMTKRSAHDELHREGEARAERALQLDKELADWRGRLVTAEKRGQELAQRKLQNEEELGQAELIPRELQDKREDLAKEIETLETRRANAVDILSKGEAASRDAIAAEREAERLAGEARENRARFEARAEAARSAVKAASERIEEELQTTPNNLLSKLDVDPDTIAASDAIEADVNRLKRQRDALGAVNLRAEEDAREVEQEHQSLVGEKTDLEEAITALRQGIASLNKEGRERLLTAFEQVNSNFSMLFKHLFGGGEANLVMVESDDPLEAGLEIMCQPPGKKLSTLSLLSGGEQTLTALALIFAVFLANPAPICVLDEVDAPLDDANVARFCDLLDEMCRQTDTRFLIITHHAVTMSRMNRLFGVTMGEQGVSQLVSVDLSKAEQMVA
ncbi:MAG: chromosome segregation protein SMC, partial [Pseudomonadota bacterium]